MGISVLDAIGSADSWCDKNIQILFRLVFMMWFSLLRKTSKGLPSRFVSVKLNSIHQCVHQRVKDLTMSFICYYVLKATV